MQSKGYLLMMYKKFEGHSLPLEKGLFSKYKKGTALLIVKPWGTRAPIAPCSNVYDDLINVFRPLFNHFETMKFCKAEFAYISSARKLVRKFTKKL